MKTRIQIHLTMALFSFCVLANAQSLTSGTALYPANPTSADTLTLSLGQTFCPGYVYTSNSYRVSMAQNAITVSLGRPTFNQLSLCPARPQEYVDLGRLPAGSYTLTVNRFAESGVTPQPLISNYAFTVSDARATKVAPFVRLDYSGHWWDPSDPGWGLFIWQNAKGSSDSLLAAWFTYGADGKQVWYTFQPAWASDLATQQADMYQASRMPGPNVPPPNPTTAVIAGKAKLDFTNFNGLFEPGTGEVGKFTYTVGSGQEQTRTIQRFKP